MYILKFQVLKINWQNYHQFLHKSKKRSNDKEQNVGGGKRKIAP